MTSLLERRNLAVSLALVACVVLAFVVLLDTAVHDVVANSDSATVALEGRAIGHGNLTLSGWSLSLDSFWTVDALFYTVAIAVIGFVPALNHVVPAAIAVLVIATGALIARQGATRRGALVGAAFVALFFVLPSHALASFLLQGPWHVATTLWCLIAFLMVATGGSRWRLVVAVMLLAAGLLGDLQTVGIGIGPMAASGLLVGLRTRRWRSTLPGIGVAVAAVIGAVVVRKVTSWLGAFSYHEAHHTATAAQMTANLGHLGSWSLALLGVVRDSFAGKPQGSVLEAAHVAVAVVIVASVVLSLFSSVKDAVRRQVGGAGAWRLDDLLLLGLFGDLALFEILALSKNPGYARYLTPAVIFAVVLAARRSGELAGHLRSRRARLVAGGLAIACTAALAAGLASDLRQPVPAQPVAPVDAFLLAHHLTNGIGDYWAASIITVETHGSVTVRPVVANTAGVIVRDGRQSDIAWYRGERFQFLIYQRAPFGRVGPETVRHTFGVAEHTYTLGKYYVLVFGHPLELPPGQFP